MKEKHVASRAVGVHKTATEKAQETADAQALTVNKAIEKLEAARAQLTKYAEQVDSAKESLELEQELLRYYQAHPLLKHQDYEETELPLEEIYESEFKGIKGRFVKQ